MSNTGKTISISHEAYLEIKRLNEENAALVKRWEELKEDLQLTADNYGGYAEVDTSVVRKVLETMKELEGGKG